ncbi:MAG: Haloalkane dehalogenase [Luteibacter sp.]|uniref:alpha/beta fold hydrolase n=1 Tax=Luteibacter sp. TaxID=1886636 RepID=UPI00137E27CB|nr:alpha/beta fold hydrolase [Luteibacter sp.]KAF1004733.1 MAG: Haloalkane dehalogenase [Luteibacter sp.]
MIPAYADFAGTFPFAPNFSEAPGFRMHYVDEGPRNGEVVLCLHGEPTWGYLFRHLVPALATTHRVIVPDHMGFGKSETPASRTYWLQDHVDNLEHFVLSLGLRDITLVMHDFGGPVGMGLAARHPQRIRRVISTNGPTPYGQADLFDRLAGNAQEAPWFRWIAKAESEGRLEPVLGELGFHILSTLKLNGFEDHSVIDDTWIEAYGMPFATPSECLGAIGWAKGFPAGTHRFEAPGEDEKMAMAGKPSLAIWGTADRTLRAKWFLPLFTTVFPRGRIEELAGVGHYCLEDAPTRIAELIRAFLDEKEAVFGQ